SVIVQFNNKSIIIAIARKDFNTSIWIKIKICFKISRYQNIIGIIKRYGKPEFRISTSKGFYPQKISKYIKFSKENIRFSLGSNFYDCATGIKIYRILKTSEGINISRCVASNTISIVIAISSYVFSPVQSLGGYTVIKKF